MTPKEAQAKVEDIADENDEAGLKFAGDSLATLPAEPISPSTWNAMVGLLEHALKVFTGGDIPFALPEDVTAPVKPGQIDPETGRMILGVLAIFDQVPGGEKYDIDPNAALANDAGVIAFSSKLSTARKDKAFVAACNEAKAVPKTAPPPPEAPPKKMAPKAEDFQEVPSGR